MAIQKWYDDDGFDHIKLVPCTYICFDLKMMIWNIFHCPFFLSLTTKTKFLKKRKTKQNHLTIYIYLFDVVVFFSVRFCWFVFHFGHASSNHFWLLCSTVMYTYTNIDGQLKWLCVCVSWWKFYQHRQINRIYQNFGVMTHSCWNIKMNNNNNNNNNTK